MGCLYRVAPAGAKSPAGGGAWSAAPAGAALGRTWKPKAVDADDASCDDTDSGVETEPGAVRAAGGGGGRRPGVAARAGVGGRVVGAEPSRPGEASRDDPGVLPRPRPRVIAGKDEAIATRGGRKESSERSWRQGRARGTSRCVGWGAQGVKRPLQVCRAK